MIVDGGSQLNEATLTALERSHVIILLLTPDLAAVKAAIDAIHLFERLGYDQSAYILPVVNRIFPNNGLELRNIESALKYDVAATIPYNRTDFVKAINTGQPYLVTDSFSQTSLAIATLAYQLSATEMESGQISYPTKLLSSVRRLTKTA